MTTAAPATKKLSLEERRAENARPVAKGFVLLFFQLAVLAATAAYLRPSYAALAWATLAGFAIHYWVPLRIKEPFWILYSCVAGAVVAAQGASLAHGALLVGLTLVVGLVIFGIAALPIAWAGRALLVAALFGAIVWAGTLGRATVKAPDRFYQVFGAAFMFRIFPYLYEVKNMKGRPALRDFLRYFFVLPQFKLNGPILDFQRMGQSLYQRSIQLVAQEGIFWIARGMIQLAVYEVVHKRVFYAQSPHDPRTIRMVVVHLVYAYCIYLRTSGIIHAFLGVTKLFGYDLTEGYRWYALARSPIDFWRRANIYWKDIMVKVVYFPVYFWLRKKHDTGAKLFALSVVFVVSWALHIWQLSWFSDLKLPPWKAAVQWSNEGILWVIFLFACGVNLFLEIRAENSGKRAVNRIAPRPSGPPPTGLAGLWAKGREYVAARIALPPGMSPVRLGAQVLLTWIFVACILSLEHAPSWNAWVWTLKFWS